MVLLSFRISLSQSLLILCVGAAFKTDVTHLFCSTTIATPGLSSLTKSLSRDDALKCFDLVFVTFFSFFLRFTHLCMDDAMRALMHSLRSFSVTSYFLLLPSKFPLP